jgi:hypothetical protein
VQFFIGRFAAEALQLAKDLKLDFEPIKQWAIQASITGAK